MTTQNFGIRPEFSPLSIARTLWKRKLVIATLWAVLSVGVYVWVSRLPAVYRATAVILVDGQKIPHEYVASTVNTGIQERLAAIGQQVLGGTQIRRIIEDLDLYGGLRRTAPIEDVLSQMRRDIQVAFNPRASRAIRISYVGGDAAVVAQVANRLANLYIEENLKSREVQVEGTAEFLETQLQEAKQRLDELETALSRYKIRNYGNLPQQENAIAGALNRLQMEFRANADALRRAEEGQVTLENALAAAEANVAAFQRAFESRRSMAAASADLARSRTVEPGPPPRPSETLRARLEALRLRYQEEHPEIRRLKAELARTEQLEREKDVIAPAAVAKAPTPQANQPNTAAIVDPPELVQARDRVRTIQQQIANGVKEIQLRKAEHQRIQRDIATYQARIESLPLREQEMIGLVRDYDNARNTYSALLAKRTRAEMGRDLERRQKAERFTLLEPAQIPRQPIRPDRRTYNLMGCFAGLALAVAVGFALELRRGVLLGEWELPPHVAVLGRLPKIAISMNAARSGLIPPSTHWRDRLRILSSQGMVVAIGLAAFFAAKGAWL